MASLRCRQGLDEEMKIQIESSRSEEKLKIYFNLKEDEVSKSKDVKKEDKISKNEDVKGEVKVSKSNPVCCSSSSNSAPAARASLTQR